MARESFEDEEVAQILRRAFVAVKVDREERPDIDAVYMAACQAMTGSGGWPLTVILTPEKKPFFAGTYFPKRSQYGRPGLMELLLFVEKSWRQHRDELVQESESITDFLQKDQQRRSSAGKGAEEGKKPEKVMAAARDWFVRMFDGRWGGFGAPPKFPAAHNLLFLLAQKEQRCRDMAEKTLVQMYRGGIFDHIGGGFCRYSTDEKWLVPHFEKMLYDNALLLLVYAQAYQATGKTLYAQAAGRTADYVLRELRDGTESSPSADRGPAPGRQQPASGSRAGCSAFCASQDADSDGQEGAYYLFTAGEIKGVLGDEQGARFCRRYGISSRGHLNGKSVPNLLGSRNGEKEEPDAVLDKLRRFRQQRSPLHRDEKILTGWNGLMIAALSRAAIQLERPDYLRAALSAEKFIWRHLHQGKGRLLARWRQGEAAFDGTLEDYAFYAWGLLECYHATFAADYLQRALMVGDEMLRQFFDGKAGGCYLYGKDSEPLFTRPKELYDGAMPSGNSAAALVMKKLAFFTGSSKWQQAWELQKKFLLQEIRQPAGHGFFLWILTEEQRKGQLICVTAEKPDIRLNRLELDVLLKTAEDQRELERLLPFLRDYPLPDTGTVFYLCRGQQCCPPVKSWTALMELVQEEDGSDGRENRQEKVENYN